MLRFAIAVLLLYAAQGFAVVPILTFHYNLPYLLEMQCKALNKFMIDDLIQGSWQSLAPSNYTGTSFSTGSRIQALIPITT